MECVSSFLSLFVPHWRFLAVYLCIVYINSKMLFYRTVYRDYNFSEEEEEKSIQWSNICEKEWKWEGNDEEKNKYEE